MHIVSGPTVTDQRGSPITIYIEPLASTVIQPGGQVCAWSSWGFTNAPPNATWCDFEVEVDPQGQSVIIGNVGDYSKPNDCYQTTGGVFEEIGVPSMTHVGVVVLLITLALISLYFVVRRHRLATRN